MILRPTHSNDKFFSYLNNLATNLQIASNTNMEGVSQKVCPTHILFSRFSKLNNYKKVPFILKMYTMHNQLCLVNYFSKKYFSTYFFQRNFKELLISKKYFSTYFQYIQRNISVHLHFLHYRSSKMLDITPN